ncbi:eukaryotic translation initiation factor 3 subunit K like protein [Zymoseptoria brevis]|uniref:Eukaryotic translation initiation factor 3 subunit K n=1 Tax=Zymoseptoria brevis TaxID=1047168 RepID=A0A0F4GLD8_9PEZI|nr:eukaryotic translation initiation factor 3 subunit K like protein [Zymoseptoria brevis]
MAALAFDYTPGRPENIDQILNGLDRYNPETTTIFQDYVSSQCENQTYDCYANLALLKLYQFNPHLTRDETTTNILVKALTIFPSPDFSLCLSLLPPYVLKDSKATGAASSGTLAEAVQYLDVLHNQLNNAQYTDFWSTLDSSDLYADLTADVHGFEDIMRLRIAMVVSQCMQQVGRKHLESWLNVEGAKFETFCRDICGWTIEGEMVIMPSNKDNEARSVVQGEKVKFDQFSRLIKRAYEQPA